jgi:branched-chain amino acid transport system permease protein
MLISTILSEEKPALVAIPLTIAALAVAPAVVPDSLAISLITVLMYAILTLSWTMFSGPTGYISLATAGLFGVGVYLSAILRGHLPIEVIVLIGGLAAFLIALAIGLLTLRLKGVYFILFTFGVAALIRSSVQWFETRITGTVGRHVAGATNETVYLLLLILFSITLIAGFLLKHSSPGLALQGIGQNQEAAEHIGINVTRVKVLTFAASSVLMGMTGAVMATRFRYIDPNVAFNPLISFLPVVMAISRRHFEAVWTLARIRDPGRAAGVADNRVPLHLPTAFRLHAGRGGRMAPRGTSRARSEGLFPAQSPLDQNEDADHPVPAGEASEETMSMLEVREVSHRFGGLKAVDGADFEIERGEIVGLIGPNGAGKTTMFHLISGALDVQRGTITFKGEDITRLRPDQISRRGLARTFQTSKLFDGMTAFENIRLALIYGNPERRFRYEEAEQEVNQMMARMGILSDRNKPVRDLSLASRRYLEIARALATNAEMLLLDESMAGLTSRELEQSMQQITRLRDQGVTIFMIEHVMEAIMGVCDRIIVFHFGEKIAEGTPEEIAADTTVRAVYLGDDS